MLQVLLRNRINKQILTMKQETTKEVIKQIEQVDQTRLQEKQQAGNR